MPARNARICRRADAGGAVRAARGQRWRNRRRCGRCSQLRCRWAKPGNSLPVASDQNWGAASTQLVHALWDQHALAIVALDRDAAHLSEQFALKAFVPVIALSDDKALTSTNVPWIFRLPAGTPPAAASLTSNGGGAQRAQLRAAARRARIGARCGWSRVSTHRRAALEVAVSHHFDPVEEMQKGQPALRAALLMKH